MIIDLRGSFIRNSFIAGKCSPENLADFLELPQTDMIHNMLADKMTEAMGKTDRERMVIFNTLVHFSKVYLKKYGCDYYGVDRVQDVPDAVSAIILWIAPFSDPLPSHIFTEEAQNIQADLVRNIKTPELMGRDARFINLVDMYIGQSILAHLMPLVRNQLPQKARQFLNGQRVAARGEHLIERDIRLMVSSAEGNLSSGGDRFELVPAPSVK